MTKRETLVTSVRTSHTDLATLYLFYRGQGMHMPSIASIIAQAVSDLAHSLVTTKLIDPVTNYSDAVTLLAPLRQQNAHKGKLTRNLAAQIGQQVAEESKPFPELSESDPHVTPSATGIIGTEEYLEILRRFESNDVDLSNEEDKS